MHRLRENIRAFLLRLDNEQPWTDPPPAIAVLLNSPPELERRRRPGQRAANEMTRWMEEQDEQRVRALLEARAFLAAAPSLRLTAASRRGDGRGDEHALARRSTSRLVCCASCDFVLCRAWDELGERAAAHISLDDCEQTVCVASSCGGRLGAPRLARAHDDDGCGWLYVVCSLFCPSCALMIGVRVLSAHRLSPSASPPDSSLSIAVAQLLYASSRGCAISRPRAHFLAAAAAAAAERAAAAAAPAAAAMAGRGADGASGGGGASPGEARMRSAETSPRASPLCLSPAARAQLHTPAPSPALLAISFLPSAAALAALTPIDDAWLPLTPAVTPARAPPPPRAPPTPTFAELLRAESASLHATSPASARIRALLDTLSLARPEHAAHLGAVEGGAGPRSMGVEQSFIGLRYARLVRAVGECAPRLEPARLAAPLACAECLRVVSSTDQLLCTRRRWGLAGAPSEPACYVNSLVRANVEVSQPYEEELAQGLFDMADVHCLCGSQVGYAFVCDKSPRRRNEHQVGRFGVVVSRVVVALADEHVAGEMWSTRTEAPQLRTTRQRSE